MSGSNNNNGAKTMSKTTLTATTEHGTFTRTTANDYKFVVVRASERAMKTYERVQLTNECVSGCDRNWANDFGHVVSWHGSEDAAKKAAAKPYCYDSKSVVLGIYPVTQNA